MDNNKDVTDNLRKELFKNEKNNKQAIFEALEIYKNTLKVLEEYNPSFVRKELWPKKYLPTATFNNVSRM